MTARFQFHCRSPLPQKQKIQVLLVVLHLQLSCIPALVPAKCPAIDRFEPLVADGRPHVVALDVFATLRRAGAAARDNISSSPSPAPAPSPPQASDSTSARAPPAARSAAEAVKAAGGAEAVKAVNTSTGWDVGVMLLNPRAMRQFYHHRPTGTSTGAGTSTDDMLLSSYAELAAQLECVFHVAGPVGDGECRKPKSAAGGGDRNVCRSSDLVVSVSSVVPEGDPIQSTPRFEHALCPVPRAALRAPVALRFSLRAQAQARVPGNNSAVLWKLGPFTPCIHAAAHAVQARALGDSDGPSSLSSPPPLPPPPFELAMCISPVFTLSSVDPLFWQALEHNTGIGVAHFVVYDKDVFGTSGSNTTTGANTTHETGPLMARLLRQGRATLVRWGHISSALGLIDGHYGFQELAINHCLAKYGWGGSGLARFLAFFDMDEFIVPALAMSPPPLTSPPGTGPAVALLRRYASAHPGAAEFWLRESKFVLGSEVGLPTRRVGGRRKGAVKGRHAAPRGAAGKRKAQGELRAKAKARVAQRALTRRTEAERRQRFDAVARAHRRALPEIFTTRLSKRCDQRLTCTKAIVRPERVRSMGVHMAFEFFGGAWALAEQCDGSRAGPAGSAAAARNGSATIGADVGGRRVAIADSDATLNHYFHSRGMRAASAARLSSLPTVVDTGACRHYSRPLLNRMAALQRECDASPHPNASAGASVEARNTGWCAFEGWQFTAGLLRNGSATCAHHTDMHGTNSATASAATDSVDQLYE